MSPAVSSTKDDGSGTAVGWPGIADTLHRKSARLTVIEASPSGVSPNAMNPLATRADALPVSRRGPIGATGENDKLASEQVGVQLAASTEASPRAKVGTSAGTLNGGGPIKPNSVPV